MITFRSKIVRSPEGDPPAGGGQTTPPATDIPPGTTPGQPQQTAPAAGGTPTAAVRPDYIPEKFWDATKGEANYEGLAKSYAALEQKMGSTKATSAAPENPEAYQLKPSDWKDDETPWNEEAAKHLAGAFHKAGLSQDQASALTQAIIEMERGAAGTQAEAIEQAVKKLEADRVKAHNDALDADLAKIKGEWGPEFSSRMEDIRKVAISVGLDPKDPDLFGNGKVLRMFGKLTSLMGEEAARMVRGGQIRQSAMYASGHDEAQAIMKDPNHPQHAAFKSGDQATVKRVTALLRGA